MYRRLSYLLLSLSVACLCACSSGDDSEDQYSAICPVDITYNGTWTIGERQLPGMMIVSASQFSYPEFPMQQLLSALFPDQNVACTPATYAMEYRLQGTSGKAAYLHLRDNVWRTTAQIDGEERIVLLKFVTLPASMGVQSVSQATYSQMSDSYLVSLGLTVVEVTDVDGNEIANRACGMNILFHTKK